MRIEAIRPTLSAIALLAALTPAAAAEEPLSAIDWLSQSVAAPATTGPAKPIVTTGVVQEAVATTILGAPSPDATGLLPPQVTGLPAALWGPGRTADIAALIATERPESLPSLRGLLLTLLLAEADPRRMRAVRPNSSPRASTSCSILARSIRPARCSMRQGPVIRVFSAAALTSPS